MADTYQQYQYPSSAVLRTDLQGNVQSVAYLSTHLPEASDTSSVDGPGWFVDYSMYDVRTRSVHTAPFTQHVDYTSDGVSRPKKTISNCQPSTNTRYKVLASSNNVRTVLRPCRTTPCIAIRSPKV